MEEGGFVFTNSNKTTLVRYKGASSSVEIPSTVTAISNFAFEGCTTITSITIPAKVTSVGNRAFMGCSNLKYIKCEADLETILSWNSDWRKTGVESNTFPVGWLGNKWDLDENGVFTLKEEVDLTKMLLIRGVS